jgi:hypothetical protein
MRKVRILLVIFVAFCLVSAVSVYAAEDFVGDDEVKVNDNGYIMSWLILEPYIKDNVGAIVSTAKDYFEDQGGEANIMPREGDEVTIEITGTDHEWVRLNFVDLKDMGKIGATVGGNELDISGRMVDNAQDYLVTYLKWDADTTVTFTLSSDDGAESYLNGEQITYAAAEQDWAVGNAGNGKASVKGGKWNVLVVGAYETGGEWGISVQVDPIPDEVNTVGPVELFAVEPVDKLSTTWANIKE